MSDILIKNMNMPKNCEGCRLIPGYCKHRNIYCMDDNQKKFIRPKDCPLIEVPTPHGRLIDADALLEKHGDWYTEEGTEEGFIGALKYLIAEQQTIIEAEGE